MPANIYIVPNIPQGIIPGNNYTGQDQGPPASQSSGSKYNQFVKAYAFTHKIAAMMANATITYGASPGVVGAGAWVFGGENAVLALNLSPANLQGPLIATLTQMGAESVTIKLAAITSTQGQLIFQNGILTGFTQPA